MTPIHKKVWQKQVINLLFIDSHRLEAEGYTKF